MTTTEKLGKKLKTLREMSNYTQVWVAEAIGVSPNTYSMVEQGRGQVNLERLEKLASIYNLSVLDLINLSDQNIFHSITHSNGICSENVSIHQTGLPEEERELYKTTIARLEEQNDKLMKLIDKLSDKISL